MSEGSLSFDELKSEREHGTEKACPSGVADPIAMARPANASQSFDGFDAAFAHASQAVQTLSLESSLQVWTALHERFLDSEQTLGNRVSRLVELRQMDEAFALIDRNRPPHGSSTETLIMHAELLFSVGAAEQAFQVFESILAREPNQIRARIQCAKRLISTGNAARAAVILEPALKTSKTARDLYEKWRTALATMRRIDPEFADHCADSRISALHCALKKFISRTPRPIEGGRLGATALVTGGLGPGGSERQLSNTVEILAAARQANEPLSGIAVAGPLHVVTKTIKGEGERDFFAHKIAEAGVAVHEIDRMEPPTALDPDIEAMLPFLSASVKSGLRLVDWLRREQIEVVYTWQDGAVLFTALPALIAEVPRFVVNVRGLPPNIRPHKYKPEYYELYKTVLDIPGSEFVSNSEVTAQEYSNWLGCKRSRFALVPNGVDEMPSNATSDELAMWAEFEARTVDATATIGSVFRPAFDKRPLQWIEFAAAYLRTRPRARFVLVGDGPLSAECKNLAASLGIAERILFVGRSRAVGYWLGKFDVFVLLSQFEGLPNALIEAQLAGIGVVATPAGGSTDAFIDGLTGLSTAAVEPLSIAEVCAKVEQLFNWSRSNRQFRIQCKRLARRRFSKRLMARRTVRILAGTRAVQPKTPAS